MTKQLQKSGLGTLSWVLPNPIWNNLVLRTKSLTKTYVLHNVGRYPVTISAVNLLPGGDERIKIVGGHWAVGLTVLPGEKATVDLQATPKSLGEINQVLRIQHTGVGESLRVTIAFKVTDLPSRNRGTYLIDETTTMDRQRRIAEQEGHRRIARVHAREHPEGVQQQPSLEGELQNSILQNPWLDSQRFDGIDPNLNPEPPLNSEARREFDNERREQEMEKQLRLGNMPRFNPTPKPPG